VKEEGVASGGMFLARRKEIIMETKNIQYDVNANADFMSMEPPFS
jgi:hypothetical protein